MRTGGAGVLLALVLAGCATDDVAGRRESRDAVVERRRRETAELAALDELLFSLPFVADYRAERREGRMHLQILNCGEGALPALDAEIEVRPARPDDRSLYAGKRKVEGR